MQPTSMEEELHRAAGVVRRGRVAVTAMFHEVRLGKAVDAEGCLPVVEEIADSVMRNPGALVSLARLKTADDYSYMHSVAVCALMVALARQIGMDEAASRAAGLAGMLHDLGKALVPLELLNKPGRLTDEEFAIIRTHPQRGHEMLSEARGTSEEAMDVCLHHHERPDGTGYPHGLRGDDVSLLARMGAVCDVYDAITSNRPYKAGWDPAESIAQMASWKGQFDPDLFQAFVRSLGIYPTGSLVRLTSGRLAVVLEQNPLALVLPVVRVFYSTQTQMPIPPQRVRTGVAGLQRPHRRARGPGALGLQAAQRTLGRRRRAAPVALRPARAVRRLTRRPGRPGSGSRAGRRRGRRAPGAAACAAWPACARCAPAGRPRGAPPAP